MKVELTGNHVSGKKNKLFLNAAEIWRGIIFFSCACFFFSNYSFIVCHWHATVSIQMKSFLSKEIALEKNHTKIPLSDRVLLSF